MFNCSKFHLVLFLALGILLAGCGKDEKQAPQQVQPPVPPPPVGIQPQKEAVTFIKNISPGSQIFYEEIQREYFGITAGANCFQLVKRNADGREILQISPKIYPTGDDVNPTAQCKDTLQDQKFVKIELYPTEQNPGEVVLKDKAGNKSYGMYLKNDLTNNGLDSMQHLCSAALNYNKTCKIIVGTGRQLEGTIASIVPPEE
ncbi:MAG: hypothetical protein HY537_11455 [Deltaproteobacteria bacterium]|nr:hypothetical protein [Deltaproteobacteria bacterium]